ncbi:hypothetical protein GCK72_001620 [Caenorhabditis remanei]|uniref:RRM domain-containing protein n=1 Tax=Caenorhabditis remanei TaxID=31234 RepID=A0A6A5HU99_CAERE|nr:hypothetical protein GCK72_001620 [Caenorhabditis remanei]KAF1769803.1 hypothetical protein GCK72_001620 [Caenorhabditis remanei]
MQLRLGQPLLRHGYPSRDFEATTNFRTRLIVCPKIEMSGRGFSVYVGNAAYQTTEQELGDYFSSVGQVTNVKIVCDRETGRPRGFAFVEFADEASAQKACEQLNGADFNGRQLRVNLASK